MEKKKCFKNLQKIELWSRIKAPTVIFYVIDYFGYPLLYSEGVSKKKLTFLPLVLSY
jgi:hypothetical protein